MDASQATLAMAGARKDGKNARTEACLACAGPCVATGLIWPLGLAWVRSLWPDVPAWVSVAWVCESCFMLLAGPLTCLTITLDRHHNPMFTMLTKGCKKSKGMCIFSKDRQQNEIVTQQTTFLTERVAISSFPPQSPDSPAKMKF